MDEKKFFWYVQVTRHLDDILEKYIKRDSFKTKSEFIRAAVRDRLEEEIVKFDRLNIGANV